jgi:predicted secreted protein
MGWLSGIVVYVILWWLVLFMVLPWGVHTVAPEDAAKGHASGAPQRPNIALKMAVTTLIAAVLWLAAFGIIDSGWITFREPPP